MGGSSDMQGTPCEHLFNQHVWRLGPQPNGVALGGGDSVYVTDTGCLHPAMPDGGLCTDANTPRTIWAFDHQRRRWGAQQAPGAT